MADRKRVVMGHVRSETCAGSELRRMGDGVGGGGGAGKGRVAKTGIGLEQNEFPRVSITSSQLQLHLCFRQLG